MRNLDAENGTYIQSVIERQMNEQKLQTHRILKWKKLRKAAFNFGEYFSRSLLH